MNQLSATHDLDLIETLTCRVRMLALSQLKLLWQVSDNRLRRRVNRLTVQGLLELHLINAHVLTPLRPLYAWRPGQPEPEPETVSRAARTRWKFAAIPTNVCVASPLAANLFGSTAGGIPKREHYDHDLLLAAAYLHFRLHRPQLAPFWVGEHILVKAGYRIKDPDAFLCDGQANAFCVIESAGRYSRDQVESFHEHCVERDLPYELW